MSTPAPEMRPAVADRVYDMLTVRLMDARARGAEEDVILTAMDVVWWASR